VSPLRISCPRAVTDAEARVTIETEINDDFRAADGAALGTELRVVARLALADCTRLATRKTSADDFVFMVNAPEFRTGYRRYAVGAK
jgi:hypothetical protein